MYIDTHCHLNFKDFKDDYKDVAARALSNQIEMIVVGSEIKTSSRSVSLSKEFEQGVYSAIGLHPIHLQDVLIKNDNENGKYEFRSKKEEYSTVKCCNDSDFSLSSNINIDYIITPPRVNWILRLEPYRSRSCTI